MDPLFNRKVNRQRWRTWVREGPWEFGARRCTEERVFELHLTSHNPLTDEVVSNVNMFCPLDGLHIIQHLDAGLVITLHVTSVNLAPGVKSIN
eukprot:scaffold12_cov368-Pavlova_lutheri.AAC.3